MPDHIPEVEIRSATTEEVVASGLLVELDAELESRYPGLPILGVDGFQRTLSKGYFAVACCDAKVVGCGAFRPFDLRSVEIKRMFVLPAFRGRGVARRILESLHDEARMRGFNFSVLETGLRQPEAIALYERAGYQRIEPFGPYVGNALSVCFRKAL
jgi:GNAT superfamily N-acetyltransferase